MFRSEESGVVRAAREIDFGGNGGYLVDRPSVPVSCYAAAATVAVGVVTAFATGAMLVGVAHHFGGHLHDESEDIVDGSMVAAGSVRGLIDARAGALSAS